MSTLINEKPLEYEIKIVGKPNNLDSFFEQEVIFSIERGLDKMVYAGYHVKIQSNSGNNKITVVIPGGQD